MSTSLLWPVWDSMELNQDTHASSLDDLPFQVSDCRQQRINYRAVWTWQSLLCEARDLMLGWGWEWE